MTKAILLADDSLTIQKVIELTFSETDYDLTTVGNGADALTAISRARPDLVMADVVMPGKNGYEVCEAIKSDPALADIPVILLSGTFEPFDRDRAERARANAIVTKPFDSKNLLVQVESLLQSHGRAPSATTVAVPASPDEDPARTRTIAFGESPASASSPITAPDFAEFPAENAFDDARADEEPMTPGPLDSDRSESGPVGEPIAFPMDDPSPFGSAGSDTAPAISAAPPADRFETDNVFEFPTSEPFEPASEPPTAHASAADREITAEMPTRVPEPPRIASAPTFLPEDVEAETSFPEAVSADMEPETSAAGEPEPEPMPREIAPDIERLAQGASLSDLASMVSRIAGPVSLSDEDVDRIARRVIEHLSEKIVRDVAWEVVPDVAEILVRQRLRELEAETSGEPH